MYTLAARSACLDRKAPWVHTECKQDKAAAAMTVYGTRSVHVVDNLKTLLAPVPCVPHTTQKLAQRREYLGYDGQLFGTQQVVEYQETTRSRLALTYDHAGAIGTHSLRSVHAWAPSELPAGQALRPPAPLRQLWQRSWMRAWSPRTSTRGWQDKWEIAN